MHYFELYLIKNQLKCMEAVLQVVAAVKRDQELIRRDRMKSQLCTVFLDSEVGRRLTRSWGTQFCSEMFYGNIYTALWKYIQLYRNISSSMEICVRLYKKGPYC